MLITRRSDYAIRICRVLYDGKVHSVREICEKEEIPKAFAYKILRELEEADFVKAERGNKGGYYLNVSLDDWTVYDLISLTEGDLDILHCMKEKCSRNTSEKPCKVHQEMVRIQKVLEKEMKMKTIAQILL